MVYYFTSSVVNPSGFIYVGKDKFESQPAAPFPASLAAVLGAD